MFQKHIRNNNLISYSINLDTNTEKYSGQSEYRLTLQKKPIYYPYNRPKNSYICSTNHFFAQ